MLICNAYGSSSRFRGMQCGLRQDRFDPYRVGLDHLALGVPDVMTLETMKRELNVASVPNNGIEQDALTQASYISCV